MDFSQGAPLMSLCRATSTHGYIVFENCNHATMVQVPGSVRKLSWMHPNEIEETGQHMIGAQIQKYTRIWTYTK